MNPLNETCIVFNESFKSLVRIIRDLNPDGCISGIRYASSRDYNVDTILESQQTIRDWFESRINVRKGCRSQLDYYAILNAVICDIERCYSWNDVFKQLEESHRSNISFVWCEDEYEYENEDILPKCICGHFCKRKNLAIVTNPHTNLNCITACDCITKIGIITKYSFKKASALSRDLNVARQHRVFTKFANLVFKYEYLRLGFRKCCDCLQYVVNILDPKWKRRCFPCWRQINPIEKSK
jgi:hypothetical protein